METVDIWFDLAGASLPRDHCRQLAVEVGRCLPWFPAERDAGIHPLRSAHSADGALLLARRAKLVLRLPSERAPQSAALVGQTLRIGADRLCIGAVKVRPLMPHATLYAPFVAAGEADEQAFAAQVSDLLDGMEIRCEVVFGRRRSVHAGGQVVHGSSVMLHGVTQTQSLLLQRVGLGAHRSWGFGLLVGHKSAAAVA